MAFVTLSGLIRFWNVVSRIDAARGHIGAKTRPSRFASSKLFSSFVNVVLIGFRVFCRLVLVDVAQVRKTHTP